MAAPRKIQPHRLRCLLPSARIALLILPFLALLLLGLYFIARDRRWVEQEARERADDLAQRALDQLRHSLTNIDFELYAAITNDLPPDIAFARVNSNFDLVHPSPIFASVPFDPLPLLDPHQSALWLEAERAEFQAADFTRATHIWKTLLESNLPAPVAALAQFKLAVLLERMGRDPAVAAATFTAFASEPLSHRLESGLPIAHVAALKLLLLQKKYDPGDFHSRVSDWIAAQLADPSEFTPYFFSQGTNSPFRSQFSQALELWTDHQRARHLHGKLHAELREALDQANSLPQRKSDGGRSNRGRRPPLQGLPARLEWEGRPWWAFHGGTNLLFYTAEHLQAATAQIAAELRPPPYLTISFGAIDNPVPSPFITRDQTIQSSPPNSTLLAQASHGALRVGAWLSDPLALYAVQRQRAWLFGGVLASSLLVAAIGLAQIHRNHRRQERLNELKSNFVSSVSHELRAPLASMRLMSEGLQSGRIHDPEKQREYFDFLVQESRRLSVLVENVLDFSRIEQNRKTYIFADANLRALCEAALKTISPVAHEHNVPLELQLPEPQPSGGGRASPRAAAPHERNAPLTPCEPQPSNPSDLRAEIDAPALQQAVVNLLDNAVKHSPPGDPVTLRLAPTADFIDISVQDCGPGIPASEHYRIFDQFYRLGSELRRETEGVGIGLTIVKHIAEAHGGSVLLESEPGQGATFTLRIPRHANESPMTRH